MHCHTCADVHTELLSRIIMLALLALWIAGATAEADDTSVRDRNRCNGEYSLVASLEGHGTDERLTPSGKVR